MNAINIKLFVKQTCYLEVEKCHKCRMIRRYLPHLYRELELCCCDATQHSTTRPGRTTDTMQELQTIGETATSRDLHCDFLAQQTPTSQQLQRFLKYIYI